MTDFKRQWVEQVLRETTDDAKFELFAADFCSELYGHSFFTTSQNYDTGIDAKTADGKIGVVCATLRDDSGKPLKDAKKIKNTKRKPEFLILAYSKPMTEDFMRRVEVDVASDTNLKCKIGSLSGNQFAQAIVRGQGVATFTRHYLQDYEALRQALLGKLESSPEGLGLAFVALATDDTAVLRETLMTRVLLASLEKHKNGNLSALLQACRSDFGLQHVTQAAVEHRIDCLCRDGQIERSGTIFQLSASGAHQLQALRDNQLTSYESGRELIRREFSKQMGADPPDNAWEKLWSSIEVELTEVFRREGLALAANVMTLVEGGKQKSADGDAPRGVADAIDKAVLTWSAVTRTNASQALRTIFSPKSLETYEWLLRLASAYVVFCTLGLETTVSHALRRTLSEVTFHFDTDVVLAWLAEHEPGHHSASMVKEFAESCGRKIHVPASVVEECARHAARSFSDHDTAGIGVREKLPRHEILDCFGTVFSREFEFQKQEGRTRGDGWLDYIRKYAGNVTRSGGKLVPDVENFESLLAEANFEISPLPKEGDIKTVSRLQQFLVGAVAKSKHRLAGDPEREEKLRIDAQMLVSLKNAMVGGDGVAMRNILVTSATVIKHNRGEILKFLSPIPTTMGLSEVMWMLSIVPDRAVSVRDLGTYLFEGKFSEAWRGLERLIYRVITKSKTIKIAQAQQGVLIHSLRQEMFRQAKKYGYRDQKEVARDAYENPALLADLLSASIDAETQIIRQPSEKAEIRERLAELSEQMRKPKKDQPQ